MAAPTRGELGVGHLGPTRDAQAFEGVQVGSRFVGRRCPPQFSPSYHPFTVTGTQARGRARVRTLPGSSVPLLSCATCRRQSTRGQQILLLGGSPSSTRTRFTCYWAAGWPSSDAATGGQDTHGVAAQPATQLVGTAGRVRGGPNRCYWASRAVVACYWAAEPGKPWRPDATAQLALVATNL